MFNDEDMLEYFHVNVTPYGMRWGGNDIVFHLCSTLRGKLNEQT